jgi:transposase
MVKKECDAKPPFYELNPQITSIGIDDFAYKKGQSYCTIICEGITRRPIEVLDGRDGKTLKEWLIENGQHMNITSVTRDRAGVYAKVITEILPEAMQTADRFHLHQNLSDAVKKALKETLPNEIMIPDTVPDAEMQETAAEKTDGRNNLCEEKDDNLSLAEQRRYEDIVRIQKYFSQGYSATRIKDLMNTTYNTIRRYAAGDPYKLCRFNFPKTVNYEEYREEIIECLKQNMTYKDICAKITAG